MVCTRAGSGWSFVQFIYIYIYVCIFIWTCIFIHIYLYVCPHLYPFFVDYMIYDRNELSQQNMFKQTVTVSRQKIKTEFFTQRFAIMWTLFLLLGLNTSHLYRPGRFLGTKSEGLWTDGASGIQIQGHWRVVWRWVTVAFPTATTATTRVLELQQRTTRSWDIW